MNLESALLWGFLATLVLTVLMSAAQGLGFSRMSIPLMLGTILTGNRSIAPITGFAVHLLNGWLFALLYALIFESVGSANLWYGAVLGLGHGMVVLVALMPLLPGLHPRMASERQGPEPTRELEPPGFMALNYGRQTPVISLISHIVYGAIVGGFYQLAGG